VAVVSAPLLAEATPALAGARHLRHTLVAGGGAAPHLRYEDRVARAAETLEAAPTSRDDVAFWLYSSGSTGRPKGVVHLHHDMVVSAETYAKQVLGLGSTDKVYSAAKLFFAYGLGNALSFPLSVGATTVLMAERPTPASVFKRLKEHRPTIFYGVPTLYAALLAAPDLPKRDELALRVCTSAGEALPADIGRRWTEHFGVEILDGIGSTEMLHIFLSNRPGEVRYGTSGKAVPGYRLRIVNESGGDAALDEVGDLLVAGPSAAAGYWNNRERSRSTFIGEWTRTGDKYSLGKDGYYTYGGRSDDMLKVGGIYVSPFEVEAALLTHSDVLEVAVIGVADDQQLVKPKAFVVTKQGVQATPALAETLKQHVKDRLAPYKYPRWVEFVSELPKTATGKIQRFKLRALETSRH
jgi:benzoate-CoA ligase